MNKNYKSLFTSLILEAKKEMEQEDSDIKDKDYKNQEQSKYSKNIDMDYDNSPTKLVKSLQYLTKRINKNIEVFIDDHKDVKVVLKDVFYVRINPKFRGYFDVEAYKNMTDRIYAIGLSFDQVLNFVKVNFGVKTKSYVQSAYDKSMDNLVDKTKKQVKDLQQSEPLKVKDVDKKEIEKSIDKKEDEPNAPMSTVNDKKIEKQVDHEPVKPKMKKTKDDDDSHTVNWKK